MKRIIITTGAIAVAGGLATAVAVSSCDPCDVESKPSVIVQIFDQAAPDGTVTRVSADQVWYEWTTEDGEVISGQAECADDKCTEWVLGDGQPGTYQFHANVCGEQFNSSSITLVFNDDGCEVDTRIVDLGVTTATCPDLEAPGTPEPPEPEVPTWRAPRDPMCALDARFSVVASVYARLDDRLIPLGADRAYYIHNPSDDDDHEGEGLGHEKGMGAGHHKGSRGDERPAICLNPECTHFAAGIELEGELLVGAEACGQTVEVEVEVGRTADDCHVETESMTIVVDGTDCVHKPVFPATEVGPDCPSTAPAPSAYLMPVIQEGDMLRPRGTSSLSYALATDIRRERRAEGYCAMPGPNELCYLWITGWGLSGDFVAYTDACGLESAVSYTVEEAEDGCGPQTAWVPLTVDTRNCIQAPYPEGNPPPTTPAAGVDITQGDPPSDPPAAGTDVTD